MLWVSVVSFLKVDFVFVFVFVFDFQVCQRSDVNFEKQAPLNFAGLDCSPPYHHLYSCFRVFSFFA